MTIDAHLTTPSTNDHQDSAKPTFQPPRSLAQLASTMAQPAAWPIPGLLPAGLCLLAAHPLAGAPLLLLQLALSLTSASPALRRFPVASSGQVLYLDFHQPLSTLLAHAQHLLDDATLPDDFAWTESWPEWDQGGIQELQVWLQDHPDTRLVVIDSLSSLGLARATLAHKQSVLHQLNSLAHSHNVAIVLLHHLSRISSRTPFKAVRCSPLLLEQVDTLAVLDRALGSSEATLHLSGHQVTTHALRLQVPEEEGPWHVLAAPSDADLPSERTALLEALQQATHALTPGAIASALQQPLASVRRLLFSMVRAGQVAHVTPGHYASLLPFPSESEALSVTHILSTGSASDVMPLSHTSNNFDGASRPLSVPSSAGSKGEESGEHRGEGQLSPASLL